jgi:hypothetical protein
MEAIDRWCVSILDVSLHLTDMGTTSQRMIPLVASNSSPSLLVFTSWKPTSSTLHTLTPISLNGKIALRWWCLLIEL